MKRALILIILFTIAIWAYKPADLYGEWSIDRLKNVSGTTNTEHQIVNFKPATVQIILKVTAQKDKYLIKNLKIVAKGIWKLNNNMLLITLQEVTVPEVEYVTGFKQKDIDDLADKLRRRFLGDPIKMYKITSFNKTQMTLLDEAGHSETYKRR